jgi:hypothetical protein
MEQAAALEVVGFMLVLPVTETPPQLHQAKEIMEVLE